MVAYILPAAPPPILGMGSGQNSFFVQNIDMWHIEFKRITNAAAWWQIVYSQNPLPPPALDMESIGQNSSSSENGHFAYQNKENHECTNMLANSLPADTPLSTLMMGTVGQNSFFQNMVMLHIKLKGIMNAETWL